MEYMQKKDFLHYLLIIWTLIVLFINIKMTLVFITYLVGIWLIITFIVLIEMLISKYKISEKGLKPIIERIIFITLFVFCLFGTYILRMIYGWLV